MFRKFVILCLKFTFYGYLFIFALALVALMAEPFIRGL
jgi:hypothetical protein